MRAAIYTGSFLLEVCEVEAPVLKAEEVLIYVKATGICGSDLYHISGKNPRITPPVILGHELVGTISAIGSEVPKNKFAVGDTVTVNPIIRCFECDNCLSGRENLCRNIKLIGHQQDGGFAEQLGVHWSQLVKLPGSIGLEFGHLVEPLAVAIHGLSLVPVETVDTVIVMGAGPIGYITAQVVRARGASTVVVTDMDNERLAFAESSGFYTVNVSAETWREALGRCLPDGEADIVVDAAGTPVTALGMSAFCRSGGHLLIIAMQKGAPAVDLQNIGIHEQTIKSSRLYLHLDFIRAVRLLESGKIDLSALTKDRFPLEKINDAIRITREKRSLKPVIDMSDA